MNISSSINEIHIAKQENQQYNNKYQTNLKRSIDEMRKIIQRIIRIIAAIRLYDNEHKNYIYHCRKTLILKYFAATPMLVICLEGCHGNFLFTLQFIFFIHIILQVLGRPNYASSSFRLGNNQSIHL